MSATPHNQPQVSSAYRLLASREHNGLKLDLYGEVDEDGYVVYDLALAGTKVSLFYLVSLEFLDSLSLSLDLTMPSAAELRRQSRAEQRIERVLDAQVAA